VDSDVTLREGKEKGKKGTTRAENSARWPADLEGARPSKFREKRKCGGKKKELALSADQMRGCEWRERRFAHLGGEDQGSLESGVGCDCR